MQSMFEAFLQAGLPLIKIIPFFIFYLLLSLGSIIVLLCYYSVLLESKTFSCTVLLAKFSSAIFQLFSIF